MIDHVETPHAAGIVDRGDICEIDKAAGGIVPEVADNIDYACDLDGYGELVESDGMAGGCAFKRANNRLPQSIKLAIVHAKALAFNRSGAPDLLLQQHDAVKQRLCGGRTAGHVDVDGNNAVATS